MTLSILVIFLKFPSVANKLVQLHCWQQWLECWFRQHLPITSLSCCRHFNHHTVLKEELDGVVVRNASALSKLKLLLWFLSLVVLHGWWYNDGRCYDNY